ncbi:helix-turn-helix domain-containing protein [Saccharothrix violaceirubra]|uniref:Transcriptional regulator GlxA family with amidase domain n=1 Tax=Saccharothrix violaceirubra TaxID=413306 RepID=A0A7W7SZY6_9PSEU|nr:helix-turn-helix domain-containing protein [Saccharothrix violaceirubra]MBB4964019.1 transcriptional regulator GlxA family with amidase domain [Saccharothrix violaceirubra]
MLHRVAVPLIHGFAPFEFGVVAEVFGVDRTEDGVPPFDFRVCTATPEPVRSSIGVSVLADHDYSALLSADLVAMPAVRVRDEYPADLLDALRTAHRRGATLLSVCSGAYVLASAGLLDGRTCATHWRYAADLAARFPKVRVDPDVLFVDEGDVITGAGTAAGIDACLHLVRRELGSTVTAAIARRMVVAPQRDGGQRQFVQEPMPVRADSLQPLLAELMGELADEHTVSTLAGRARMSERTFARRFAAETGTSPHRWITAQRVLKARRLLEESNLAVEQIAHHCGFGTAALLRHHFTALVGVAPKDYRRTFAQH